MAPKLFNRFREHSKSFCKIPASPLCYEAERTPAIGTDYFPYDRMLKTRTKKLSQSHYDLIGRAPITIVNSRFRPHVRF
jgi:hypothetical protein